MRSFWLASCAFLMLPQPLSAQSGQTEQSAAATDGPADVSSPQAGATQTGAAPTGATQQTSSSQALAAPAPSAQRDLARQSPPSSSREAVRATSTPSTSEAAAPEDSGPSAIGAWLELQGAYTYANLVAFSQTQFSGGGMSATVPSFAEVRGEGVGLGVGAGLRLWWLTLGTRLNYGVYSGFEISTWTGELGLRFPLGILEPYLRVGFGYAWQTNGNYQDPTGSVRSSNVYGWVVEGQVGLDFRLASFFSIGAGVGVDLLNLTRQSDPTAMCMAVTDFCPRNQGDAFGFSARGFGQIGFHL